MGSESGLVLAASRGAPVGRREAGPGMVYFENRSIPMVRIADPSLSEKLAEVVDRVTRGEHVIVELADGRGFEAVPIESDRGRESVVPDHVVHGGAAAGDLDGVVKTALGRSLLRARAEALRHGEQMLDWEGIEQEIAERRGERGSVRDHAADVR